MSSADVIVAGAAESDGKCLALVFLVGALAVGAVWAVVEWIADDAPPSVVAEPTGRVR